MTKIMPFRGIVYNQERIANLLKVVCPPYDVISPSAQRKYYHMDNYNIIRLALGKEFVKDNLRDNRYTRAAELFNRWQEEAILRQDGLPSIYPYSQDYLYQGKIRTRRGFVALMKLKPSQRHSAFPHEVTQEELKQDRLQLIRKVRANLSPVFCLFSDTHKIIDRLFGEALKGRSPFIDLTDEEKISHRLWRISDPSLIEKIKKEMERKKIFIADGHHRYEVALSFRDEMRKGSTHFTEEESFNYIMTYFCDLFSPALTILPVHRVIGGLSKQRLARLETGLNRFFTIQPVKDKQGMSVLMEKASNKRHLFGLYQKGSRFYSLQLKDERMVDKATPHKGSREWRRLDTVILQVLILGHILKVRQGGVRISYTKDVEEAIATVEKAKDGSALAFFLNPPGITQIRDVALAGERLPPKSTYFYPKLLTGLVINKFNQETPPFLSW